MSIVPVPTSVRSDPRGMPHWSSTNARSSADADRALAGQTRPHVTHFAAAHRVGLSGERERAAAGFADRAGGQVQVADRVGVPGAVGALVEAHRPAAHPVRGLADPAGSRADVFVGDAGDFADVVGGVLLQEAGHHLPALGELGDEFVVGVPVFDDQVQQPVEQREIGAGGDLQEQVGLVGGRGAARVDDDQLGAGLDAIHHAQEQDRVAVGHVGADHEEHVGVVEVLVGAGRPVGAQRQLVAGARAGHAQPRVRLDLVGADEALWSACSPGTAPRWTSGPDTYIAKESGPCSSMIARNRCAAWVIALSMSTGSRGSPRSVRTCADSIRPGAASRSDVVAPLVHNRPKFAGCSLLPIDLAT